LPCTIQGVESVYDLVWANTKNGPVTYRDVFHQNEVEQSEFNFDHANVDHMFKQFDECETACNLLIEKGLALPAYEQVLKASHTFNLLDARHAISVTERQRFILRVRTLSKWSLKRILHPARSLASRCLRTGETHNVYI